VLDSLPAAVSDGLIWAAERRLLSDALLRTGVRGLVRSRSAHERAASRTSEEFAEQMRGFPVAVHTGLANEQHYEVPSGFFEKVLGPYLKYSCSAFEAPRVSLAAAEEAMLARTCARAGIENGMRVLDFGCGWGSITRYVARNFPDCEVLAVSNSKTQRAFITGRCEEEGLQRVQVMTANAATVDLAPQRFDRIISVEMFEHMRNWHDLFGRVASWLEPDGAFFMHVFCHREHPYLFEDEGSGDWMARHFFSGGIMPSYDLPRHIDSPLVLANSWRENGRHYARTSRAWLDQLDASWDELLVLFERDMRRSAARQQLQRWRMFFIACEELFAYAQGEEWFVAHHLLRPEPSS